MTDKTKKIEEVKPVDSLVIQNMHTMSEITKSITNEQWVIIKQTIAPSLNDPELRLFLYRSHKLGLDPLNGEIFAYASGSNGNRKMVVIVARDGKRVIAERTGKLKSVRSEAIYRKKLIKTEEYDGTKKETIEYEKCEPWEGGELWGATCTLYKKDSEAAFAVTVPLSEYKMQSPVWSQKPETMIKKVAESQALSQAFPEMSGVYDESEKWDEPKAQAPLQLAEEDANRPATEAQLNTLKNMLKTDEEKSEVDNANMTFGEAANRIRELIQK